MENKNQGNNKKKKGPILTFAKEEPVKEEVPVIQQTKTKVKNKTKADKKQRKGAKNEKNVANQTINQLKNQEQQPPQVNTKQQQMMIKSISSIKMSSKSRRSLIKNQILSSEMHFKQNSNHDGIDLIKNSSWTSKKSDNLQCQDYWNADFRDALTSQYSSECFKVLTWDADFEKDEETFSQFQLRIYPLTGGDDPHLWVELKVSHPKLFEGSCNVPQIEVLKDQCIGLNDKDFEQLDGFIMEKQIDITEGYFDLSSNQVHLILMHIQDFLGPIYEKCPQHLQKLADKEKRRLIKDKFQREKKILEKQEMIVRQQKKLIRNKMEEDMIWRQQLISSKQLEITRANKEKEEEEHEQFIKLYQDDDILNRKSILNFPIVPYDRYKQDFEELAELGQGGGGKVYKVLNRADRNIYCIKVVKLSRKNQEDNKIIRREVDIQSRLQNQYIVRYYNSWAEHIVDKEKIRELDFDESDDEDEPDQTVYAPKKNRPKDDSLRAELFKNLGVLDSDVTQGRRRIYSDSTSFIQRDQCSSSQNDSSQNDQISPLKLKHQHSLEQESPPIASRQHKKIMQKSIQKASVVRGKSAVLKSSSVSSSSEDSSDNSQSGSSESDSSSNSQSSSSESKQQKNKYAKDTKIDSSSSSSSNTEEYDDVVPGISNHQSTDEKTLNDKSVSQKQQQDDHSPTFIEELRSDGIYVLYIQIEYCQGGTLEKFLEQHPFKEEKKTKWKMFSQMTEAISYVHSKGLIHRDLKPGNIFLDSKNNVKLGDFGLTVFKNQQNKQSKQQVLNVRGENDTIQQGFKSIKSSSSIQSNNLQVMTQKQRMQMFRNNPKDIGRTIGIGSLGYVAPEQQKGAGNYNEKADMYSLGAILFDLWWDFKSRTKSTQTRLKVIRKIVATGKIESQIAGNIPQKAQELILLLLKEDPEQRPTAFELLASELMPSEFQHSDIFKNYWKILQNHKNIENLKLMNFLFNRKTNVMMDYTYEGGGLHLHDSLNKKNHKGNQQNKEKTLNNLPFNRDIFSMRDLCRQQVRKFIQGIFESYGARELDTQLWAPACYRSCIFVSREQFMWGGNSQISQIQTEANREQLVDNNNNSSLIDHVDSLHDPIDGQNMQEAQKAKASAQNANISGYDPLNSQLAVLAQEASPLQGGRVQGLNQSMASIDISFQNRVLQSFEKDIIYIDYQHNELLSAKVVINHDRLRETQEMLDQITTKQTPPKFAEYESEKQDQLIWPLGNKRRVDPYVKVFLKNSQTTRDQVKTLDELGLVLCLQDNALKNYARYVALHERGMHKMVLDGQLYAPQKRFTFAKVFQRALTQGSLPNQKIEASFDIIEYQQAQVMKSSKQDKDEQRHQDQMQTIINECEVLNVAFNIGKHFCNLTKLKFEVVITCSEIVDAIMDECKIPLQQRHRVIEAIGSGKDKTLCLKSAQLSAEDIDKFKQLIKINGKSVQELKDQLSNIINVQRRRFDAVFKKFKRILRYLSLQHELPSMISQNDLQMKQFNAHLNADHSSRNVDAAYQSSKKLRGLSGNSPYNQAQLGMGQIARSRDREPAQIAQLHKQECQLLDCIKFDFGLYFNDSQSFLTYYSGLFFKVVSSDFQMSNRVIASTKQTSNWSRSGRAQPLNQISPDAMAIPRRTQSNKNQELANKHALQKPGYNSRTQNKSQVAGIVLGQRTNPNRYSNRQEIGSFTIAVGGRFDNLIAQHQIYGDHDTCAKTPKGYNLRVFFNELVSRLMIVQKQNFSFVDVFVVAERDSEQQKIKQKQSNPELLDESSNSDCFSCQSSVDSLFEWAKEKQAQDNEGFEGYLNTYKIKLVNELRNLGVRVESDVQLAQNFFQPTDFNAEQFCRENNIRYLVTFKQKKREDQSSSSNVFPVGTSSRDDNFLGDFNQKTDDLEKVPISVKIRDLYAKSNSTWRYEPRVRNNNLKQKIQEFRERQIQISHLKSSLVEEIGDIGQHAQKLNRSSRLSQQNNTQELQKMIQELEDGFKQREKASKNLHPDVKLGSIATQMSKKEQVRLMKDQESRVKELSLKQLRQLVIHEKIRQVAANLKDIIRKDRR